MGDFSKEIMAYALQNAIAFGKCDAGKILPKLFQHGLDKKDIKGIMPSIQESVTKVNRMSPEEREKTFVSFKKYVNETTREERTGLPDIDLQGVKRVVTRMAPEPSKYTHVGHALTFLINYLYAKKYKGTCVLRFEDANPEKVSQEYVNAFLEDVRDYLGIPLKKPRYVSDDIKKMYVYAGQLITQGQGYICFCERQKMQDLRHQGVECECRQFPVAIQAARWKEFVTGKFSVGEAVMRLKGDMQSDNHVMRDPVLFRRIDTPHYRKGKQYKVWPLYDFYNPIEDSLMGVTLILRSNEFDARVELQDYLKKLLGLKTQRIVQYGRFNVIDFTTKGREIRELVDSGELMGWDDPRLITLRALRRRGITREALYELANQIGLSKHPVNLEFDMIAAINRKLVDASTPRFYFVRDPVEIGLGKELTVKKIDVPVHPDTPRKTRSISIKNIFIAGDDAKTHAGQEIRLLHLCNVQLDKQPHVTSYENKKIPRIQWVSDHVKARILMPDGKWVEGSAEKAITKLKKGTLVQFERVGFARYDGKAKDVYEFWFAHA